MEQKSTAGASPSLILTLGLAALVGYVGLLMFLMQRGTYDQWGGLLVAPLLVAVSVPIFVRESRRAR